MLALISLYSKLLALEALPASLCISCARKLITISLLFKGALEIQQVQGKIIYPEVVT